MLRRLHRGLVLGALGLLLGACPLAAEWVRYRGPHFELWTDASRSSVQRVANAMQSARVFFENARGPLAGSRVPGSVRVVLFAAESEFRRVAPRRSSGGFSRHGAAGDWIILHAETSALDRVVMHEYTHLVVHHNLGRLPEWVEEGLAEYYSTAEAETRGEFTQLSWAAPIPTHRVVLTSAVWLDAARLESTADAATVFYPQSWAMVHMLAESPAYRDAFPDFLKDNPAEGDPALQKAFGKGLKDLITEAQRYFARPVLAAHIERLPGRRPLMMIERDSGVELEAAELRADLLWQAGRQREAWRLFERLAAQQSRPELALVARAYLALQQSSPEEALPLFERAIAAGVGSPGLLLQYAILMRESKADETVVEQAFEKAAAAGSAEAAYLLGMRRSAAGRHAEALESLEAAAKAMPDRADVWHALAYARQRSGAIEGSRFAARQALLAAESPQELDMALALLESIDAAMAPQQGLTASSKPAVYAPPTWDNPKGDSLSEGLLRYVECEGTTARLSIESEGRLLVLSVLNPRKVVWRNAPGGNFELTCGPQAPRPVVVEYKRTTQEITAIEFR